MTDEKESLEPNSNNILDIAAQLKAQSSSATPERFQAEPKGISINNNLVGGYDKGTPKATPNNSEAHADALANYVQQAGSWGHDKYFWGKNYAYGAGSNDQHFERYYSSPKYSKLGFSPYRDNEAYYNQNSTLLDDARRGFVPVLKLAGAGFASPFASSDWVDKTMNENMKLASVTRGGVGATLLNFGANAAFTTGIGLEMVAENVVGITIAGATGGGAAPLEAAIAARTVARVKNLWDNFRNLGKVSKALEALKEVSTAKNFYSRVTGVAKSTFDGVKNLLNPFEHTTKLIDKWDDVKNLSNWGKTFNTFGAFYKDARGMNLVRSESALEGAQSSRELQDKLVTDYYNEHSQMPDEKAADLIYQTAKSAEFNASLANVLGIYLTNKMVFENSFKGFRSLADTRAEAMEGLSGVLERGETTPFAVREKSLKGGFKALVNPSNLGKGTLKYIGANLAEGIQETTQGIIQDAVSDYYTKLYKSEINGGRGESLSLIDSVGAGLKNQASGQGLENFASGFFMAGFLQASQHLLYKYGSESFHKLVDRVGFDNAKAYKEEYTKSLEHSINELAKNPKKLYNDFEENIAAQYEGKSGMQDAQERGDKKSFLDIQDESKFNHIYNVAKAGKTELLKDYLNDMMKLEGKDLQNAFGEETDDRTIRNKINSTVENLDYLQKRFNIISERFRNPFNPSKYSSDKQPDEYTTEYLRWKSFEDAKKVAIYSGYSFDQTTKRMQDILEKATADKPLSKGIGSEYTNLFNTSDLSNTIKGLETETSLLNQTGSKLEYKKSKEKLDALKDVRENLLNYQLALALVHQDRLNPKASEEFAKASLIGVGDKVKTIKGEGGRVEKIQGRYVTLDNGKRYKRHRVEKIEGAEVNDRAHYLHTVEDEFRTSYGNYLKKIANQTDDYVFDEKVNSTFDNLRDFYALHQDSKNLSKTVNVLQDPQQFMNFTSILNAVNKANYSRRDVNFKESYRKYKNKKDANDLLNELHNRGYWIDEEGLKSIFEDGKLPKNFVSAGETHTNIPEGTADYKKAADLVGEYFKYKDIKQEPAETPSVVEKVLPTQTASGIIHIIRHGKTIEDEKGINSGPTQEPITEEGVREVREGAAGKVDENLRKIITSGRERAKDSAQVIAEGKDIVLEENSALDPWNTGDSITGFAEIKDEDWKKFSDWFALHPDERVYSGDDEDLKTRFPNRSLSETFNEFKQRVLSALPHITNELTDGGAILTHSNVIQLIKAYVANGSVDNENVSTLYVQNKPSENGEFIEFPRIQLNPDFVEGEVEVTDILPETHAKIPQDEALKLVEGRLLKVTTGEALDELYDEVEVEIAEGDYTSDGIEELFEKRKEQLSKSFSIKDIKPGEVVLMNDKRYGLMKVVLISKGQIKFRKVGEEAGAVLVIPESKIQSQVKYKYSSSMTPKEFSPLKESEKKLATKNRESNVDFMNNVARIKKLADETDAKTTEQVNNEFFNNLGCK